MWDELNARRQIALIDFNGFCADALQNFERVFTAPREDRALNDVVLIAQRRRTAALRFVQSAAAEPQLIAELNLPDVADCNRCVVAKGENGGANIIQRPDQAEAAHDEHLGAALDIRAAGVLIA